MKGAAILNARHACHKLRSRHLIFDGAGFIASCSCCGVPLTTPPRAAGAWATRAPEGQNRRHCPSGQRRLPFARMGPHSPRCCCWSFNWTSLRENCSTSPACSNVPHCNNSTSAPPAALAPLVWLSSSS